MISMMFEALQAQAKKYGYMIFNDEGGNYLVVDLVKERIVSREPDIEEVADLLGGLINEPREKLIQQKKQKRFRRVPLYVAVDDAGEEFMLNPAANQYLDDSDE